MRSCLGCGRRDAKPHMLRIVRDDHGALRADPSGAAAGRGGYLHPEESCWKGFETRSGMVRSFKAPVQRTDRAGLVGRLRQGVEQ
ncbi:MAG TPA: YlxR family protein [Candidatus Binatia bacterium]|nr:YlxR family protein [Candidatus Binatia bacterium]